MKQACSSCYREFESERKKCKHCGSDETFYLLKIDGVVQ